MSVVISRDHQGRYHVIVDGSTQIICNTHDEAKEEAQAIRCG